MPQKSRAFVFIGLLITFAVVIVAGLARDRLQKGDLYPPYSSLRSDPLGTEALKRSLERMSDFSVSIQDQPWENSLEELPVGTLLVLGVPPSWMVTSLDEATVDELERYASRGGRVVIGMLPRQTDESELESDARDRQMQPLDEKIEKKDPHEKKVPEEKDIQTKLKNAFEKKSFAWRVEDWDLDFGTEELPENSEGKREPVVVKRAVTGPLILPESMPWHSAWVITQAGEGWVPLFLRGERPVAIEKKIGSGSILVLTDSYPLSNEALWRERNVDYLFWLISGASESKRLVIFDEFHHGVVVRPGLAMLMRKYQLHGFVFGLLLLSLLFIWKSIFPMIPPSPSETPPLHGSESGGLRNLLRRSVAPEDLLKLCFSRWMETVRSPIPLQEAVKIVVDEELALPPSKRHPVAAFRKIQNFIQKRKIA